MDPYRRGQCPTVARLGDEAHIFADANAMRYAPCCVIGEECESLHGNEYEIGSEPALPVHPNYRCTVIPVIEVPA